MNPSSGSFYDRFKDRRYGLLFFFTFWIVFGSLLMPPIYEVLRDYSDFVGVAVAVIAVPVVWISFRALRRPRGRCWEYRPLSCDEVNKARAKLMKCQNWKGT